MNVKKCGVFGPFDVPRCKAKRMIDDSRIRNFWEKREETTKGLPYASGCYIFGIRAGKGATPWYVGQAKNTFLGECFMPDKLLRYNKILADLKKGAPILLLLARQTPKGKFQKKLAADEADSLEYLLIGNCLRANPRLLNISRTSFFREAEVPSLLNSPKGPPSDSAKFLRRLLNLG